MYSTNSMCLIIFEEKSEIQDQHPLSLNRDRDRLQKYWANVTFEKEVGSYRLLTFGLKIKTIP